MIIWGLLLAIIRLRHAIWRSYFQTEYIVTIYWLCEASAVCQHLLTTLTINRPTDCVKIPLGHHRMLLTTILEITGSIPGLDIRIFMKDNHSHIMFGAWEHAWGRGFRNWVSRIYERHKIKANERKSYLFKQRVKCTYIFPHLKF